MAAELVSSMAAVGTLIATISEVSGVLAHVYVQVVLPLGDIAALGAHVVLVAGVRQHVLGQIAHISAGELAALTLVGLLTCVQKHVPDQNPLVCSGKVALRALVDLLIRVHLSHVVTELYRIEGLKGAEITLQLLTAWVALSFVFAKRMLVGTDKGALITVERIVALAVRLHLLPCGEE